METDFEMLLYLAKKGFGEHKSSTLRIAKELGFSQQTVSRKLRSLESYGMIKRSSSPIGVSVAINDKGIEALKRQYSELSGLFMPKKQHFSGEVKTGFGEGKYYVSIPKYQREFKKKLGFAAYPGTLNLVASIAELKILIHSIDPIKISGFETKSRTYGSISCYKTKIDGTESAIVIPERTRHAEEIIEIIAPVPLREKLKLKDGDKIRVDFA